MVGAVAGVGMLLVGIWVLAPLLLGQAPLGDPLGLIKPPSSSSSPGETYLQAAPAANAVAASQGSGWTLRVAEGISLTQTFTPVESCGPDTIPLNGGTVGVGTAPWWVFLYAKLNPSNLTWEALAVEVGGGSSTVLQSCTHQWDFSGANPIPTTVVDSSEAAELALNGGGSQYLAAHPNASANYMLADLSSSLGGLTSGPFWEVVYSVCPFTNSDTGVKGSYPAMSLLINASTGMVESPSGFVSNSTVSCGPTPQQIPVSIGWSTGSGSTSPNGANHYDNVTVAAVSGPLNTSMFILSITSPGGTQIGMMTPPAGCQQGGSISSCTAVGSADWYGVLLGPSGTVLAVVSAATWNPAIVTVAAGDSVCVVSPMTLAGSGDTLAASGWSGYTVSGSVTL